MVATPIGNLGDLSLRAREIFETVDIVLAEDTRHTKVLLNALGIQVKGLKSFHAHSTEKIREEIIRALLEGKTMALVSDAGTPGISDPGVVLVSEAIRAGVKVSPIPGASAIISALSVSGLPTDRFSFFGYVPHKKGRKTMTEEIADSPYTVVVYESKHRIQKFLEELAKVIPERKVVLAREMTKIYEEFLTGTPLELQKILKDFPEKTKGEFVVVISGKSFR